MMSYSRLYNMAHFIAEIITLTYNSLLLTNALSPYEDQCLDTNSHGLWPKHTAHECPIPPHTQVSAPVLKAVTCGLDSLLQSAEGRGHVPPTLMDQIQVGHAHASFLQL